MANKQKSKAKKNIKRSNRITKFINNKKFIAGLVIIIVAAIGTYIIAISGASPGNCQADSGVSICDIDQVLITTPQGDSVLSQNNEAKSLADQKRGIYYGAAFRAPIKAFKGAVPVYRVYNADATYHDFVVAKQKNAKAAKGYKLRDEGIAFYAWETKVAGTVPVYRITRGGGITQAIFSTDKAWIDKMVASGLNNNEGWKKDAIGDFVAFYAYPPNYTVAGQVNPYDCSIQANYLSDRCKGSRENLDNAIKNGDIPKTSACPADLNTYLRAPFPGQFDKACQDKWNKASSDCSKSENFVSERCKAAREAFEKAEQERQAKLRAETEQSNQTIKQRNDSTNIQTSRSSRVSTSLKTATDSGQVDCSKREYFISDACTAARSRVLTASAGSISAIFQSSGSLRAKIEEQKVRTTAGIKQYGRGECIITYKMTQYLGIFGHTSGTKTFKNKTRAECLALLNNLKGKTIDGMNRDHYDYKMRLRT